MNYTVIRLSGKADFYSDKEYYYVLNSIYEEFMSAGSNWDRPKMLLANGAVVVENKIADIAWDYGNFRREAYAEADRTVREKFKPDWLE